MINIHVENTNELIKDLREAQIDIQNEARAVLKEMAIKIQNEARNRAPKDTGLLRDSIRHSVSRKQLQAVVRAGGKVRGGDAYYAYFIEFGTKYIKAKPFLLPAARYYEEDTQKKLTEVIFDALRKGVSG